MIRLHSVLLLLVSLPTISSTSFAEAPADEAEPSAAGFVDHFKGKHHPAWQILNPQKSHYSLEQRPNALTITTQKGGLWSDTNDVKNLFVLDNPIVDDADFVMTTRLDHFNPQRNFNQAGLVCLDDLDNFLIFSLQWDQGQGGRSLCLWAESQGQGIEPQISQPVEITNRIWLRITKQKNSYEASISMDGKEFEVLGATAWGEGSPLEVGLVAKNGASRRAPEVAASFDFFEIRPGDQKQEAAADEKRSP